jgi:hypothetical protein
MNGTLTIEGPLDTLAEVAQHLHQQFPDGLVVEVEAASWEGWTVSSAENLLRRLAGPQRSLLTLIVEQGGVADGASLRQHLGNETGSLKGLTGPISKHVKKMIRDGFLPEGTPAPTTTIYDPENPSYQRAGGIRMEPELVDIFRTALEAA